MIVEFLAIKVLIVGFNNIYLLEYGVQFHLRGYLNVDPEKDNLSSLTDIQLYDYLIKLIHAVTTVPERKEVLLQTFFHQIHQI